MAENAAPDASETAARDVPPSLRIGVLMQPTLDDVGSFLADATAFEAAGADSLWLAGGTGDAVDPWTLLAALTAVTQRVRLGALVAIGGWPPALLATTIRTLDRLSRGRLIVGADVEDAASAAAVETVRRAWRGPLLVRFPTASSGRLTLHGANGLIHPAGAPKEAATALADVHPESDAPVVELWCEVAPPQGRADWAAALAACVAAGAAGLIVPQSARLLDIVRNPVNEDDRADLLLAQG